MKVYIGIDWSSKKHDIVITDEGGKCISAGVMEHSQKGFTKLEQMRRRLEIKRSECVIGLETAHTLVIDHLWQSGYEELRVIHPNICKQESRTLSSKWGACKRFRTRARNFNRENRT